MTKISSGWMKSYKKVFPVVFLGFLVLFAFATIPRAIENGQWLPLVLPCFMAAVGIVVIRKTLGNLVDEVYDCGDYLVVRNAGEEEAIPLHNIMNVSVSVHAKPPRITLRLVKPGKFGQEVTFSPVFELTLNPFARSHIADDLIVRVDKARVRRVA